MKQKFTVGGMSCAACQAHVQKAVSKLDGVNLAEVSLLSNSMLVDYDDKICDANKIISAVKNAGYSAALSSKTAQVNKKNHKDLIKLLVAATFLILIMYISMGPMIGLPLPNILSMHKYPLNYALSQLILVIPIIIIYFKFFKSGYKKLFKLSPNMDSLIALSATASLLYGIVAIILISVGISTNNHELVEKYHMNLYFESAGMILVLVSSGKYLEMISKRKTTKSITKLMDLAPKSALILKNNEEIEVPIEDVKINDIVIVKKGDSCPVDGIIVEGSCSLDEANITGESIPVYKKLNDTVYSSTINVAGYIKIKATKVGEDTSIANIIKLVEEASNSKAPISKLADKIAGIFVPIVMGIALLSLIISLIAGATFEQAFNFAISVLVVACPCSLGLATPVAIMVGTGVGAENGLLIKNAEILEKVHSIKTVVLDKTGTITEGKPKVVDYIELKEDMNLLSIIYSIELKSEHPLAQAVCDYASSKNSEIVPITNFKSLDGKGLIATYEDCKYYIGNTKTINEQIVINQSIKNKLLKFSNEGKTALVVTKDDDIVAILTIKDQIKENAKTAIKALKSMGINVVMLTGDNYNTAQAIAKEIDVDDVIAEVLPVDKQNTIKSLIKDNKHLVAMVGDGVNDALALATADIGISLKGASDVAIETSDIVLLRGDLLDVVNVIRLSKRVLNTIKGNLFWAFFYNCIAIVLASGLLYPWLKVQLNPMIGSLAMSLSSVFVVCNALTINLFKVLKLKKEVEIMEKIVIKVEGMMCDHCKKHVEDAVSKVDGVVSAVASVKDENVVVEVSKSVDKAELVKNIEEAGYKAF